MTAQVNHSTYTQTPKWAADNATTSANVVLFLLYRVRSIRENAFSGGHCKQIPAHCEADTCRPRMDTLQTTMAELCTLEAEMRQLTGWELHVGSLGNHLRTAHQRAIGKLGYYLKPGTTVTLPAGKVASCEELRLQAGHFCPQNTLHSLFSGRQGQLRNLEGALVSKQSACLADITNEDRTVFDVELLIHLAFTMSRSDHIFSHAVASHPVPRSTIFKQIAQFWQYAPMMSVLVALDMDAVQRRNDQAAICGQNLNFTQLLLLGFLPKQARFTQLCPSPHDPMNTEEEARLFTAIHTDTLPQLLAEAIIKHMDKTRTYTVSVKLRVGPYRHRAQVHARFAQQAGMFSVSVQCENRFPFCSRTLGGKVLSWRVGGTELSRTLTPLRRSLRYAHCEEWLPRGTLKFNRRLQEEQLHTFV
jgi:hypothetical protein